jgi:hypothetical protein
MSDFYPSVRKQAERQWLAEVTEYDVGVVCESGPFPTQREAVERAGQMVKDYRANAESGLCEQCHSRPAEYRVSESDVTAEHVVCERCAAAASELTELAPLVTAAQREAAINPYRAEHQAARDAAITAEWNTRGLDRFAR